MDVLTIECNKCEWHYSQPRTRATAAQVAINGLAAWKAHKASHTATVAPLAPRTPLYVVTGGEKGEKGRPYIVADASLPNATLHAERRQEAHRRPMTTAALEAPRTPQKASGRSVADIAADAQQALRDELQKRGMS